MHGLTSPVLCWRVSFEEVAPNPHHATKDELLERNAVKVYGGGWEYSIVGCEHQLVAIRIEADPLYPGVLGLWRTPHKVDAVVPWLHADLHGGVHKDNLFILDCRTHAFTATKQEE